jgi:cytochrome P450
MQASTTEAARPSQPPTLRQLDELPHPPGLPLVGNALQIDADRFHLQLEQWCRTLGPTFTVRMGKNRLLVIGDHEVVAAVLRDRPDGFRRSMRLAEIGAEMGLPPGVFNANGETWRRQRRMVMAGFDPAHVKGYYPSMQKVARRLSARWSKAAQTGQAIDLQADLMRFTVDTIAGLAFGSDVNTLESDEDVIQKHLDQIFPALSRRMISALPWWRWFPSAKDRALERSVAEVNAAVAGFIAQARARLQADPALREHPENLLEAMIVAADQPESGIDDTQVAGNVMTMLLAGEDTTANTLAWMIHLLWRNPEALARATEEVRAAIAPGEAAGFETIAKLHYIEACAHETMRLKPVGPFLLAQALHDTVVGDVQVPKDTVVLGLLRRDAVSDQYVEDASAFRPQRWLTEEGASASASNPKRISMPFGAGPRMCPGRYLALLEMKVAMAVLLADFDIVAVDTPDGDEPAEQLSFTMSPVGLTMRLRHRAA